jgi:hypothetical protein
VISDGAEATREQKLLAWAGDYAAQRAELVKAKRELARVGPGGEGAGGGGGGGDGEEGGGARGGVGARPSNWR